MARPYDENHREALRDQLDLPVTERICPVCDHAGLRSYHHEEFGRSGPSMINYLWCPACHAYASSFTAADRRTVDRDPLADAHGDRIAEVMRDPEGLLRILDGYWTAGSLPQQMLRRPRG
ncbi:hypothetical protein [Streptomyces sp. NRRL S-495]|uniref:hypothetical protein n=1 Tax=Streptomyces sp. NRRL S-495 TaxID=1609133 RepID=UPI0005F8EEBB|nr:hypothetical protein [Streptomyces sp. NRRL S-495]KJY37385.1 hypothetical protein VR45_09060 [Streptomyces sp. NRRL S-495]